MNDTNTAPTKGQPETGPAILRYGFRPFFLGAGVWSALSMALWLLTLEGDLDLPSAFAPVTWHAHEMIFGYAVATVCGFLLTAIPNWTGRLPIRGASLGLLFLLWLGGRVAVVLSGMIGATVAAAIDVAFLAVLLAVVLREIVAGGNWRNLPMAGAVAVLLAANVMAHLEALEMVESAALAHRLAIGMIVVLITLVGGRIVPSFTRNWLAKRGEEALPAAFNRIDRLTIVATLVTAVCWTAAPEAGFVAALAFATAIIGALRLARWRGLKTGAEPLVWVLHLGYAWVPVGFALIAASAVWPELPPSAALHALTVGGVGTMTLAVMTRATLGHTGRPLTAGAGTTAIYLLVTAAALLRVASPLAPGDAMLLLQLSGLAWFAAFALFVAIYGTMMVAPRIDGNLR